MSITRIRKRIATFYDNKGAELGKKSFNKTDSVINYDGRTFNVSHDKSTYTVVHRWYWDLEIYHYNIDDPNPMLLDKKHEPIITSEMYTVQLETKLIRDLNNVQKKRFNLDGKTILLGLGALALIILIATGKVKL